MASFPISAKQELPPDGQWARMSPAQTEASRVDRAQGLTANVPQEQIGPEETDANGGLSEDRVQGPQESDTVQCSEVTWCREASLLAVTVSSSAVQWPQSLLPASPGTTAMTGSLHKGAGRLP
jgi:hypothetical protein